MSGAFECMVVWYNCHQLFTCLHSLIDGVVRTDDMEQAAAHANAAILYHKNEFKVMHAKAAAACAHVHL